MHVNKPSFADVARTHRAWLCRVARGLGVSAQEVDDVVQDVLTKGFERWWSFEGRSTERAWLCGILIRLLWNRRRKHRCNLRRRELYAAEIAARPHAGPEPAALPHQLHAALATLDDGARDVLVMCEIEGYKYREVAEALDLNPNTVASRLWAARHALRRYLQPKEAWALVPGWNAWSWGMRGIGGFCKGFVGAVVFVFAAVILRPDVETVDDAAREWVDRPAPLPKPQIAVPPGPTPKGDATHPKPTPRPVSTLQPRPKSSKPKPQVDHQSKAIERLYFARQVAALGAPTCARAIVEDLSAHVTSSSPSDGHSGPWMDHATNPGALLESVCRKTSPTD